MISPFLISVREGLEMALIIAIVLAYLAKTDNRDKFQYVWMGLAAAVLVSAAAAGAIFMIAGSLEGRMEKLFEGVAMLTAVAILTWMIFWMRKIGRNLKNELETHVSESIEAGSGLGMFFLIFVAVVREGLEEALFLFSAAQTSSATQTILGAALGLGIAAILGYIIYSGSRRLNLKAFFNVTSVILILIAAGLLAHGLHEFLELGLIDPIIPHVWDMNQVINEKGEVGSFLTAIFGYNGDPSLIEVIAYFSYLGISMLAFLRPMVLGKLEKTRASTKAV